MVLSALEVCEDTAEGRHADARADDDRLVEVVESLGWGAVGAVNADVREICEGAEFGGPVAVCLNVEFEGVVEALRDGEGVPLPAADLGDLQEDVLARSVGPEAQFGDFGFNHDGLFVEDLEGGGDFDGASNNAQTAFEENHEDRKRDDDAHDWKLEQFGGAVRHEHGEEGKH